MYWPNITIYASDEISYSADCACDESWTIIIPFIENLLRICLRIYFLGCDIAVLKVQIWSHTVLSKYVDLPRLPHLFKFVCHYCASNVVSRHQRKARHVEPVIGEFLERRTFRHESYNYDRKMTHAKRAVDKWSVARELLPSCRWFLFRAYCAYCTNRYFSWEASFAAAFRFQIYFFDWSTLRLINAENFDSQ